MSRITSLSCLIFLSVLIAGAFSPAYAEPGQPLPTGPAVIVDATHSAAAADPAQAKAEAEFRKVVLMRERAYYAGNIDRFLSFYADDVVSIQPGMPDIVGKQGLVEGLRPFLAANRVSGKFTLKEISVSGDLATRQGQWDEVWRANDGSTAFHQVGRCLVVWRKIDGQWKVVKEFVNFLVPPTDIAVK